MISNLDIERGIYALFTGADRAFSKVDLGGFLSEIKPGLNVAVSGGTPEMISLDEYRWDISIVCLVAVKNLRSEMERRRLIHPLVQFVYRTLVHAEIPLIGDNLQQIEEGGMPQFLTELEEIQPGPWKESTDLEQFKAGESVFELRFTTGYTQALSPIQPDDLADLHEILATITISDQIGSTVQGDLVIDTQEGVAP